MRLTPMKTGLLTGTRRAARIIRLGSLFRRDALLGAGGGLLVPAIVVISLAASACGNKFTGEKQVYTCSDGKRIEVIFSEDRDRAMLRLGDDSYKLNRIRSGYGVKYSNGDVVFWNKGQGAVVQIKGQVVRDGCRLAE